MTIISMYNSYLQSTGFHFFLLLTVHVEKIISYTLLLSLFKLEFKNVINFFLNS